ncbi:acyl-phosphate glycerol-3-phosphate acyltransferase [Litorimonas taeanensis]|uniref:Glycerol-3-phosphate acyltransferase n=1 Tax=Litorimonas taeanensis TaxID=568099 RepID=A0A420WL49_9PROT|nr:glycerol-3-phosphate 1-O-acyltransferase PlsY [Litorimonas taeanensis]RKQ71747.1 acyl-phosphate glycerol-3-phosphate acyltransferase [Litorimonas taeanensis]
MSSTDVTSRYAFLLYTSGGFGHDLAMDIIPTLTALITGYLLGSIPFGLLLAKATGQGDIRNIGSGNIGATNVLRTGRKDIAALTLILDAAKAGGAGLVILHFFGQPFGYMAAAAALVGHCYPIWLGFKGGKGVATFFGGLFALAWPIGIFAAIVWLSTAFITRLSSLGALLACVASSVLAWFISPFSGAVMVAFMAFIILIRHRENIARLMKGEESKIGQKGK